MEDTGDIGGEKEAVLSAPLSLDDEQDTNNNKYRAPNLVKRILSLFTNIRPGSDLTRLQASPSPSQLYTLIIFKYISMIYLLTVDL